MTTSVPDQENDSITLIIQAAQRIIALLDEEQAHVDSQWHSEANDPAARAAAQH